jgi:hypothetical protein
MNEVPPGSTPAPPPAASPDPDANATQAVPAVQPAEKQRLRDRLWSFRAVIAVALASVIVGGLGGAALANVSNNDEDGRFGPGAGRFNRGGPPGMDRGPLDRKQFPDRRGMGQRQWGQGGVPPVPMPTPAPPSPTG